MPGSVLGSIGGAVAGKVVGKLFGSDGKQVQQTTANQAPIFPKYIPAELENLVTKSRALMDKPYEAYTGPRVQGLAADEQSAYDTIRALQGQYQTGLGDATGIANQVAQRGLQGFDQNTLNAFMNPYRTNVMDISKQRQFDDFERQKTALQQKQAQTGAFGGSRSALAQGQLYDNFSRQLAEQEAQQLFQGYSDSQNRAMAGTAMAGQFANSLANYALQGQQAGLQGADALAAAGTTQRGLGQQQLDVNYQDFLTEQQYPYQQLQFGAGMINPIAGITSSKQMNQVTTGSESGGSGLAGQAVGLGALAKGFGVGGEQGGGISGYFGNLMNGSNSIFNPITYSNVNSDLNNLFSSSPGLFKKGGQVPFRYKNGGKVDPRMLPEENDILSRLDSFYEMLQEGSRDSMYPDEDLDQPVQPGGPTRRELLRLWEQETESPSFDDNPQSYKCGGKVKGYADGGRISALDSILQMYTKPAADWRFNDAEPEEVAPKGDLGVIGRLINRYNSGGGMAGSISDLLENTLASDAAPVKYVRENPVDAFGNTLMVAPGLGLAGKGLMAAGKGALALTKGGAQLLAKYPGLATSLAGAGISGRNLFNGSGEAAAPVAPSAGAQQADNILAQTHGDDPVYLASQKAIAERTAGDPEFQRNAGIGRTTPPDVQQILRQMDQGLGTGTQEQFPTGSQSYATRAAAQESTPSASKSAPSKAELNSPLIAFGAAMLGSKNNFMKALGEASGSYVKEKQTVEGGVQKRAQQEIENAIEAYKAQMYGKQVETSMERATGPWAQLLLQAKVAEAMGKAKGNKGKLAADLFKAIKESDYTGSIDANTAFAQAKAMADQLSGGSDDSESSEEESNDITLPPGYNFD